MKQACNLSILLIGLMMLLSGCGLMKLFTSEQRGVCMARLETKEGATYTGYLRMPMSGDKELKLFDDLALTQSAGTFKSEDLKGIELSNPKQPDSSYRFEYKKFSSFLRSNTAWMALVDKGPELTAYLLASSYKIDENGDIFFIGNEQRIIRGGGSMAVVKPSFPLFLEKRGGPLRKVALVHGINYEGSQFRGGVVRFLADDPDLCSYVRGLKWEFEDIDKVVKHYDPHRKGELVIKDDRGQVLALPPHKMVTDALSGELIYTADVAKNLTPHFGMASYLGLRSSLGTYFTYGGSVGFNQPCLVDDAALITEDPSFLLKDRKEVEVPQEFIKRVTLFSFNAFAGLQVPLDLRSVYVIPSLSGCVTGDLHSDYSLISVGPLVRCDLGIPLKYGNMLFFGAGYKYGFPIKDADEMAADNYKNVTPYGQSHTVFLTIGYMY